MHGGAADHNMLLESFLDSDRREATAPGSDAGPTVLD